MERVLMIELITRSDVFTENMDERRRRNAGSPVRHGVLPRRHWCGEWRGAGSKRGMRGSYCSAARAR